MNQSNVGLNSFFEATPFQNWSIFIYHWIHLELNNIELHNRERLVPRSNIPISNRHVRNDESPPSPDDSNTTDDDMQLR